MFSKADVRAQALIVLWREGRQYERDVAVVVPSIIRMRFLNPPPNYSGLDDDHVTVIGIMRICMFNATVDLGKL